MVDLGCRAGRLRCPDHPDRRVPAAWTAGTALLDIRGTVPPVRVPGHAARHCRRFGVDAGGEGDASGIGDGEPRSRSRSRSRSEVLVRPSALLLEYLDLDLETPDGLQFHVGRPLQLVRVNPHVVLDSPPKLSKWHDTDTITWARVGANRARFSEEHEHEPTAGSSGHHHRRRRRHRPGYRPGVRPRGSSGSDRRGGLRRRRRGGGRADVGVRGRGPGGHHRRRRRGCRPGHGRCRCGSLGHRGHPGQQRLGWWKPGSAGVQDQRADGPRVPGRLLRPALGHAGRRCPPCALRVEATS